MLQMQHSTSFFLNSTHYLKKKDSNFAYNQLIVIVTNTTNQMQLYRLIYYS